MSKLNKSFLKRFTSLVVSAVLFGAVAGVTFNYVTRPVGNGQSSAMINGFGSYIAKDDGSIDEENSSQDSDGDNSYVSENSDFGVTTTSFSNGSDTYRMDVSDIVQSVMPAVVSINVKTVSQYDMFYGYMYETEGSGSGIIVGKNDTELLIVTNNHVVEDATTVEVCFVDGESYEAIVKGTDSDNDIAIIVVKLSELSIDTLSQIQIAKLGNSDEINVGEQVVAIGNAMGYGQSVTTGIISAKDRQVSTNTIPLIQTDAAINPGNSGGALLNMNGEVIGINSSKYMSTEVEGMGYAIPISKIENILDELMNKKTRDTVYDEESRGYLGISCSTVGNTMSYWYFDYGTDDISGVYVNEVAKDTPAYKVGLREGDIITQFDGQTVSSVDALTNLLQYYQPGERVEIKVLRSIDGEYEEKVLKVKLVSKEDTN